MREEENEELSVGPSTGFPSRQAMSKHQEETQLIQEFLIASSQTGCNFSSQFN